MYAAAFAGRVCQHLPLDDHITKLMAGPVAAFDRWQTARGSVVPRVQVVGPTAVEAAELSEQPIWQDCDIAVIDGHGTWAQSGQVLPGQQEESNPAWTRVLPAELSLSGQTTGAFHGGERPVTDRASTPPRPGRPTTLAFKPQCREGVARTAALLFCARTSQA